MALLNLFVATEVAAPSGLWEWLILKVFPFIGSYGWRVVLFTVCLKCLLLPIDFFQKVKMRKNQRITESIAPQMDRLKRQYANDPRTLQLKMTELQRKAGFSMWTSCVSMLLTLVVFITLFSGLRNISQYMEFKQYVGMYDSYVEVYEDHMHVTYTDKSYADGFGAQDFTQISKLLAEEKIRIEGIAEGERSESDLTKLAYITAVEEKGFAYYYIISRPNAFDKAHIEEILLICDELLEGSGQTEMSDEQYRKAAEIALQTESNQDRRAYLERIAENGRDCYDAVHDGTFTNMAISIREYVNTLVMDIAADAAKQYYIANHESFLWVKSLWVADVPWKDAVPDFADFKTSVGKYMSANKGGLTEAVKDRIGSDEVYSAVTVKVREDGSLNDHNGYLILVVLVAGLSLLSQYISGKQQKKAGQMGNAVGMDQMKVMMWMMPIMLGFFALSYTTAFTLYMLTNSAVTVIINLFTSGVLSMFDKRQPKAAVIKYGRKDPHELQ